MKYRFELGMICAVLACGLCLLPAGWVLFHVPPPPYYLCLPLVIVTIAFAGFVLLADPGAFETEAKI